VNIKIRKIARIHDKGANTYLDLIEFPISKSSQKGTLVLPPSVVGDRSAFVKRLRDAGADLPKDRDELKQTLEGVAASDPPEKWVYEAQTGWLHGQKAFVLTGGVIGETKAEILGVNPAKAAKDYTGRKSERGDWQGWRDNVAKPARHSTTLMVAICAALAAPLLDIVRGQSFAINFFGPTRAGKSIATLLAASVIGIGRAVDLISWKITDARLEERLPEFNDLALPIDDLNTMRGGNDRQKYGRIQNLAYAVAQGSETQRSAAYVAAHNGRQGVWRTIVITSSEKSVHDFARSLRLERQRGEALRLIDVPATFDGHAHVFDRLPRCG
jgi:putative DNA primase/helicase